MSRSESFGIAENGSRKRVRKKLSLIELFPTGNGKKGFCVRGNIRKKKKQQICCYNNNNDNDDDDDDDDDDRSVLLMEVPSMLSRERIFFSYCICLQFPRFFLLFIFFPLFFLFSLYFSLSLSLSLSLSF